MQLRVPDANLLHFVYPRITLIYLSTEHFTRIFVGMTVSARLWVPISKDVIGMSVIHINIPNI